MSPNNSPSPPLLTVEQVREALRQWSKPAVAGTPLLDLLLVRQQLRQQPGQLRHALNTVLRNGLQTLAVAYPQEAEILRLHYQEEVIVAQIATRLNAAEITINKKQQQAIHHLTETLLQQETAARQEANARLLARLELPSYNRLFGVDAHLQTLSEVLCQPTAPWLIVVEGMGGLGKTALTDYLLRQILTAAPVAPPWADLAWVTARQQIYNLGGGIRTLDKPALTADALIEALYNQLLGEGGGPPRGLAEQHRWLQTRLKSEPHLLVIDNLETVTDVEALLDTLRTLVNPSKCLLNTRHSLVAHGDLYHLHLHDLSPADAYRLIRYEAEVRHRPDLQAAPDATLERIYQLVGGNPLALRLVVGQTHLHALDTVLAHLSQGRGPAADNLYRYLYRHAWENLDEKGRQALVLMPLIHEEGEPLDFVLRVGKRAGVDETDLLAALDQLVQLNLVESRGNLTERRYTIHGLTRTFLQEEVLSW